MYKNKNLRILKGKEFKINLTENNWKSSADGPITHRRNADFHSKEVMGNRHRDSPEPLYSQGRGEGRLGAHQKGKSISPFPTTTMGAMIPESAKSEPCIHRFIPNIL